MIRFRCFPALLCAFVLLTLLAQAQEQDDTKQKDNVASFVDSVAGTIYKLAWPTATYKSWSFDDFRRTQGGYKVVIKLSGLSAFDDSSLWLKLGLLINSDGLKNVWVVDHNAILVPPFKTTETIAALGVEIAKQYSAAHPSARSTTPATVPTYSSAQADAVCLLNASSSNLNFSYRWGGGPWKDGTVEAGKVFLLWWTYTSSDQPYSPQLQVEYDDSFAYGYTGQRYALEKQAIALPATCENARQYRFTTEGEQIYLNLLD